MKHTKYLPYICALAGTVIYLSLIFNDNVWMDEAFSASIIRCGFREMAQRTFADTLPPFYNFSAWCFTRIFGFSTRVLKIYSVLPMFLLMIMSAVWLPRAVSGRSACLYIAALTAMPYFLEHGTEIRMYSWAVLFASGTAIFALCVIKGVSRAGAGLVICTVLGAYTHQFALIAEAFIWLMLLFFFIKKKETSRWLKAAALCIILYIPCAILTVFQLKAATSYFSAALPTVGNLTASLRYPFVTHVTVISGALLLFFLLLLAYALTKRQAVFAYYMLIYSAVIFISFGVMKVSGSSFFSSRYLMPAIGILWLGAALTLDMLLSDNRYVAFVAVILAVASLIAVYSRQFSTEYVDMSEFQAFIDATGPDDGYVIYEEYPEIEICLGYYAPWLKKYSIEEADGIDGKKYLFVNGKVHTNDVKSISDMKFDLKYIEELSFDRYTFKAYELTESAP